MGLTGQLLLQALCLPDQVLDGDLVHESGRVRFGFLLHQGWRERKALE